MLDYKKLKKMISIFIVIAFFFNIQNGILLHSQEADELENQFNKAKHAYKEGKFPEAIQRIERIIQYNPDRKELLGQCHLLLGAVYEQRLENQKAEINYKKARYDYGIESIEGIDLEYLPLYQEIVKGKKKDEGVIEHEGSNIIEEPGKFPVLLVIGAAAVTVAIILLTKKKKKQEYTLTVNLSQGVEGTPPTGTNTYEQGTTISYNYTLDPGYNNLVVQLNGTEVSSSGTITMNQNHTLTASANTNDVNFVTDKDEIQIPEDSTASFNVRLSAQPTGDVNVTVARESGDTDISVISGSNLNFNTSNWNTNQTVTLQASQDPDTTNGQATIAITAPDAAGIPQKNIIVTEQDDDVINDLTVRILEPKNGTQVTRGTIVEIEAVASSSSGVQKVEFYIKNDRIKQDDKAPYTASWDTTGYLHGVYIIKAKAFDNNGNTKEHSITVEVLPQ